ncbi:hypothetical protein PVIIG_05437 [Plasmodium vivax India VII]|uniref:Dolichyl-diphosphooligosaccharide--protein glycosyltransferase subunit OST3/OST6 n=2 Tax=Plasmodium vivax TaxID=5855 RepID=A0A0J9V9X6_PLAVI|nr:hypothetical protein PVIIG_05437 [Plasmodium vivax India VII]
MRYSQILLSRLLRLRFVLPLLLALLLLLPKPCGCLGGESKLAKLQKLINKKIKLDINEKYRSEKDTTNQYISFLYIHEITAGDYVEYVLNKSGDYDCVLFVIDVESTNGVSKFDRKNLMLLELFNRVAKAFILGNFSLYSEGGSGAAKRTTPIGANGTEQWTNPIRTNDTEQCTPPASRPIFFFYINIYKPSLLPLKYIHAIDEVPEFFYVGQETFLHFDYYSKVRPNYKLEGFLKEKRSREGDTPEMSNQLVQRYFSEFIRAHNRGGSGGGVSGGDDGSSGDRRSSGEEGGSTPLDGNYLQKMQKHSLTIALVGLFSLLYVLLQLLHRWPSLLFVCSYVLFLTCLSGIFHCLINKSERYNTAKNLDSMLHKFVYRSTSAQYVYEGVAFSLFIFLITFALFLLCRYSTNTFMPRGGRNLWLTLLLLLTYSSLDVIHEINLFKVYYSTYFFFPPAKFFRK